MKKVAIIGSGNWGTVIARIVGKNVCQFDCFENTVNMYVFEETVDGKKLTEIINARHENVKYLPGFEIPHNVVAVPDVLEAAKDADVLIWVLPHKFIRATCSPLIGRTKPNAVCLSLIKGFDILPDGGITLISEVLKTSLNTEVGVMMGANLAGEVADDAFCESTIGCRDLKTGAMLKRLMQTENFRISIVNDVETIEVCGALKNVVAVGAGFVDGLGYGSNTKAAVMRLGLMEMVNFAKYFHSSNRLETFFESCGIADLITTCYGGRNRKIAEAFVVTGKKMEVLEEEMLKGQRVQGPQTAEEVYMLIHAKRLEANFPLFVAIHRICIGELPPDKMIDSIRNHPEYLKETSWNKNSCFDAILKNCGLLME